jgi:hypothetical protein
MRLTWTTVLFFLALASRATAQAPFVLEWSAIEGCPPADAVEREVSRLLGDAPRAGAPIRVRATVRAGPPLQLELITESAAGGGTRTIEGASCDALAQAGALVIAMAIDPEAVAARAPEADAEIDARATETATEAETDARATETATEAGTGTETEAGAGTGTGTGTGTEARTGTETEAGTGTGTGSESELESESDTERGLGRTATGERPPSFLAQAHATLGIGPLPSPSPGGALALGARISIVEIWAGGAILAEQVKALGVFDVAFGSLGSCIAIEVAAPLVELAPCATIEVGAMWGTGRGLARVQTSFTPWVAIRAGLGLRIWIVDGLAISVLADLEVPILRPEFYRVPRRGPEDTVHAPDAAGFLGGIGLMVRAP